MKRKLKVKNIIILLFLPIVIGVVVFYCFFKKEKKEEIKYVTLYAASAKNVVNLYDEELKAVEELVRGTEVKVKEKELIDENTFVTIEKDNKILRMMKEDLVKESINILKEKEIYVRTSATLYEDLNISKINGLAIKGETLDVIGFDKLLDDGSVNAYKIKKNDDWI